VVMENDTSPATVTLQSNLPITCQAVNSSEYLYCGIKFAIRSSENIAMRQRLPQSNKTPCVYEINEEDWKPNEGYAYDNDRSLDVVAKVLVTVPSLQVPRHYMSIV